MTMSKRVIWTILVMSVVVMYAATAFAAGPGDIQWNDPMPMAERIAAQGPVEEITADYDDYGVELSKRAHNKAMLTGYVLPDGWKDAIGDVQELVLTNSGGLAHDPATVINAKIFEKLTGVHLNIIEMKDPLLWPKTLAVSMAKSTDVDIYYATRSMLEIPHLSAAGWILNVDVLWPEDVQALFPEKLLGAIQGPDGSFYGSPLALWNLFLFYRPSWLEQAGVEVPETWQELVVATKKVGDWAAENLGPGNAGMVYPAGDPDLLHHIWAMTTFSQGKRIVNEEGKVVLDPLAWQMITDLWLKGGMSQESVEYLWSTAPEVFAKGKAGFTITGGVYINMFADPEFGTGVQDDWGVTLVPAWEGVGEPGMAVAGNDSWMINPNISDEKKAAAMLWLDFERSYQAQFNELYLEGNESEVLGVYDHPKVQEDVSYPDLRIEAVQKQIGESYPPGMMDILSVFKEYLHRVALGMEDDPEAARQLIQEEIDMMQ
ncbi:extracellular solute-binding protein [candidate division KSB3 bacterium]|uniref:Extracellular solute-binding protein n=1 Tax=candidate division KSB3 bacterium TaxID=2044937 RepID=A0A9D5Q426_9BACT|nr:extracellular solute-binding protein [candidate division KSB3 bacterium]MBD3323115.1 extracellular solute-binding protein [candidate division KSB3 bacterium]